MLLYYIRYGKPIDKRVKIAMIGLPSEDQTKRSCYTSYQLNFLSYFLGREKK